MLFLRRSLTGVDSVQYAGDMTYQALQDYQVGGIVSLRRIILILQASSKYDDR